MICQQISEDDLEQNRVRDLRIVAAVFWTSANLCASLLFWALNNASYALTPSQVDSVSFQLFRKISFSDVHASMLIVSDCTVAPGWVIVLSCRILQLFSFRFFAAVLHAMKLHW